jgi:hypothetical protein
MTTMSIPSTQSLTSALALLRAIGNPRLKLLFWFSRNLGAGCRPRNGHPPKWVTISNTELSCCQAFFRTPVNKTAIQYP